MALLVLYTIRDLEDNVSGVSIRVRVLEKEHLRIVKTKDGQEHSVVDTRVGDRTGTIMLTLWDERIGEAEVGDVLDIVNGYVSRFKGKLRLSIGKFGNVEKIDDTGFPSVKELSVLRGRRRYPRGRVRYGEQF